MSYYTDTKRAATIISLPMAPVPTQEKIVQALAGKYFFERGKGKLIKTLQCVLCLESATVFPYLINCLSQR